MSYIYLCYIQHYLHPVAIYIRIYIYKIACCKVELFHRPLGCDKGFIFQLHTFYFNILITFASLFVECYSVAVNDQSWKDFKKLENTTLKFY